MANNDDDSKRSRERPEDNPFIAFRRFADSQVSSLLNTVFTLPATIANYNNVHQAREACLFKKADDTQCEKLKALESEIADLRHEGRELYRVGDLQQVLKKSEELMKLDRQAEDLRRNIVAQIKDEDYQNSHKDLVQRVANKKGQEWGWDWSWGFPKPFDDDSSSSHADSDKRLREQQHQIVRTFGSERQNMYGDEHWPETVDAFFDAVQTSPFIRDFFGVKTMEEVRGLFEDAFREERQRPDHAKWWRFPPPTDAQRTTEGSNYSPRALEADERMQKLGVNWREAYNDLLRAEQEESTSRSCPWRDRRRARGYPKRVPWEGEETNDEPSYEYSHDHEDQHDDPPTPKPKQGAFVHCKIDGDEKSDLQEFLSQSSEERQRLLSQAGEEVRPMVQSSETELDVYEHVLSAPKTSSSMMTSQLHKSSSEMEGISVLSTLTTTERTVAPDGSITTKVVLKKRFADGREESSETVHTQRGQEPLCTPGKFSQQARDENKQDQKPESKKSSGWFWSS